jgi:hypothetical protein
MPRALSDAFKAAIFSPEMDPFAHVLVTIEPADDAPVGPPTEVFSPIRIVFHTAAVVSNSLTFNPWPFEITLPLESRTEIPRVQLKLDNIDTQIITQLRNQRRPPKVKIEIVSSDDLDTVEIGPFNFTWRGIEYDAMQITGDLELEDILSEPFPTDKYVPAKFQGVF